MTNPLQNFFEVLQEIEYLLIKEKNPNEIEKIQELTTKLLEQYSRIREYIQNLFSIKFNKSIIMSKSIEEKVLKIDALILELTTNIETILKNIKEIRKYFHPQKEKILEFQIKKLSELRTNSTMIGETMFSLILDINELIEEFNYENYKE